MATGIKLFAEPQKIYTGSMESLFLRESLVETDYPLIIEQGAFLVAGNVPKLSLYLPVLGDLVEKTTQDTTQEKLDIVRAKYPKLYKVLDCIWLNESSRGINLVGDHGNAVGPFQIWYRQHGISKECALDFECSLDFTAEKIMAGKGYLWTTYNKCKSK